MYKKEQKLSKKEKRNQKRRLRVHNRKQTKNTITSPKKMRKISRRTAHGIFGHINNDSVNESSSYLEYEVLRGAMNHAIAIENQKQRRNPFPKFVKENLA